MTKTELIWGWLYLFIQLMILPSILVIGNLILGSPLSDSLLNFLMFAVNFIAVTVIFHRFLWNSLRQALHTPWRCLRGAFIGFALHYLGSFLVNLLISFIYPEFVNVNDQSIISMTQEHFTLMTLGTVFLVPVAEEALYRGLIFRTLYQKIPAAAYIVSALVFSAIHVIGYIGIYEPAHLALCFLQYIPASFALGFAYAKADNIWAPILMHITVNQVGILSMR